MDVSLFATCLVHQLFPGVGKATVRLLERLGHRVRYHLDEPCCGQVAFNAGYRTAARQLARRLIACFSGDDDLIVTPSGSCASMIRNQYEVLFAGDPEMYAACQDLKGRLYELSEFLVAFSRPGDVGGKLHANVYYHASCHLHRELGVTDQPLRLLSSLGGLTVRQPAGLPACCGFGGIFSVKYPEISDAILEQKIDDIVRSQADIVTAGDMGCLMHIWGGLRRRGIKTTVLHYAEILGGGFAEPSLA